MEISYDITPEDKAIAKREHNGRRGVKYPSIVKGFMASNKEMAKIICDDIPEAKLAASGLRQYVLRHSIHSIGICRRKVIVYLLKEE